MALEQLNRYITCLENEDAGPRREALINNMYYHIFTNNMVEYIGKQNIAKQLKKIELQGEDVFFWKALLVKITIVTEKMKTLKNVLDNLCVDITNCAKNEIKYEKMWRKFVLLTNYPQIFICYPESFNRGLMMEEMLRNCLAINEYTENNVDILDDIINGTIQYNNDVDLNEMVFGYLDSDSEDSQLDKNEKIEKNENVQLENTIRDIVEMGYSEKQFIEAFQLNFNDIEMTYDYLVNNVIPESYILYEEENSDEWRKVKEVDDDRTLFELWSEYLNSENKSPQKLIELFGKEWKDPNYIFFNLLRSEVEYYLIVKRDGYNNELVEKWEDMFSECGPELIALHKRICEISIDSTKRSGIINEWNTFLKTNDGSYESLFEEFFSNMDNMYLAWLAEDNEFEALLFSVEQNCCSSSPIIKLFYEYVCIPSKCPKSRMIQCEFYDDSEYELDSYDDEYSYYSEYSEDECLSFKEIVHPLNANKLKEIVQTGLIDARDEFGETLIMNAVRWRQDEAVIYLVKMGAKLNIQNRFGKTVLHMTCGKLHKDKWSYIPILLGHGADPEIKCNTGKTPMMYAIQNRATSTIKELKDHCGFQWFFHRRLVDKLPPYIQKILVA